MYTKFPITVEAVDILAALICRTLTVEKGSCC